MVIFGISQDIGRKIWTRQAGFARFAHFGRVHLNRCVNLCEHNYSHCWALNISNEDALIQEKWRLQTIHIDPEYSYDIIAKELKFTIALSGYWDPKRKIFASQLKSEFLLDKKRALLRVRRCEGMECYHLPTFPTTRIPVSTASFLPNLLTLPLTTFIGNVKMKTERDASAYQVCARFGARDTLCTVKYEVGENTETLWFNQVLPTLLSNTQFNLVSFELRRGGKIKARSLVYSRKEVFGMAHRENEISRLNGPISFSHPILQEARTPKNVTLRKILLINATKITSVAKTKPPIRLQTLTWAK